MAILFTLAKRGRRNNCPRLPLLFIAIIAVSISCSLSRNQSSLIGQSADGSNAGAAQRTINVRSGDDLQELLDEARPGDVLVLEAGASFPGPLVLPAKPGSSFITLQSSALGKLPGEGQRISPRDAAFMPRLLSPGGGVPALTTAPGAHHYRFVGIEFTTKNENDLAYDLITLGKEERSRELLPHHLTFDRCYIHAHPNQSLKRGIALNSASTDILNSHISGFKVKGQDSQAVCGWNGPGPYRLINNYLEGAGENVMFGGALPTLPGLVPSDIEIRGNHFSKPVAWRGTWSVKNLFELKNARRVIIDANVFEYCWADAQTGKAIVLTPRPNDSGAAAVVEDVKFTNNIVRHAGAGVQIAGQDDLSSNPRAVIGRRIILRNNLFHDIDGKKWGSDGAFLIIGAGAEQIEIDHNTVVQTGNITKAYGQPVLGFIFTNNVVAHNEYGIMGDGKSPGITTLETYFPGFVLRSNVIAGESAYVVNHTRYYPSGNLFPTTLEALRFVDAAANNYRLQSRSPYRGRSTDGKDIGCDFDAMQAAGIDSAVAQSPR